MMKIASVPPAVITAAVTGNCLHVSAAEGASVVTTAQQALERNVQESRPAERIVISAEHWGAPLHLPSTDAQQLQRLADRFGKTVSVKSSAPKRGETPSSLQVSWFPKPARDEVIEALIRDGSATAVRTLLMMLQLGDTSRLPQVADALRRFPLATVENALLTTLADRKSPEERRGWAALALDNTKSPQVVEALEHAAAGDPSAFVRNAAITALREIAAPNRLASIFALTFEEPGAFIRELAITALGRLGAIQAG